MAPKNNLPTPFVCVACNIDGKPFQTDKTNARSVNFIRIKYVNFNPINHLI